MTLHHLTWIVKRKDELFASYMIWRDILVNGFYGQRIILYLPTTRIAKVCNDEASRL